MRFVSKFVKLYKARLGSRLVAASARKVHVMQFNNLIFAKLKHAVLFEIENNPPLWFLLAVLFPLLFSLGCLSFFQLWYLLVFDCVFQSL